jgi:superfamily II DNA or RNA helicase
MKDGIYEQLLNEELKKNLDDSLYFYKMKKVSPDNAKNLITDYLKDITKKALDCIREENIDINDSEYLLKEISICNEQLDLLRNRLNFDEYKELNISDDAEVLEYAFKKLNNSSFDGKNLVKPITSLVEPTLFTNNSKEISLLSELKKEIASCDEVLLLVSFIRMTGLMPIYDALKEHTSQGKKLRVISTTYMRATDYKAIKKLLELPNTSIKISYETNNQRLHAKAYIFKRNNGYSTFYIGSSNLSRAALMYGDEWNVKLTERKSPDIYQNVLSEFETYWNSYEYKTLNNTEEDLEELRLALSEKKANVNYYENLMNYKPYDYQEKILEKLDVERNIYHRNRNLVVAATGVGKTVLAAFDFKRFLENNPNAKFLYVVHRKEILEKSIDTFRQILKNANFGELYVGKYKPSQIDRLFTTTIGANNIMENIEPDFYDYIVVDEIHHAKANTYDKLLNYVNPKLLLGLTATPERMDGKDITDYFDHNIAAEMRLPEAINKKLLVPFQYYGITDPTDLSNVRWTSFGYNNSDLDKIFVDDEKTATNRVNSIITNLYKYVNNLDNVHGLGFCSSINHARYMAQKFNENNICSIYLTGDSKDEERENAIKKLESGEIKFIFTVDLYNEGIDIPCVNVELLLRPTDSLTIFLQQLGRGLRKFENKDYLTVLDFIGEANKHFNYADKLKALIGHNEVSVKDSIDNDFPLLPVGCSIALEKVAQDYILANIKANTSNRQRIIELMQKFEETTGKELTLNNFLKHYQMNINELYKKDISFYRLLNEAGIKQFEESTYDNTIVGRLKNMFSINSPKFICYIKDLLNSNFENDELLKTMTYYTFYNKVPLKEGFNSIDEALNYIKISKCLNFEINQICDYLYNNLELLPVNNDLSFDSPLEVYGIYTQAQIYSGLGVFNDKYAGPMLQGVWYLKEKNHDIFLSTLNKSESHFGESISYNDYPINDELFNWQTQNSVSEGSDILNRYIHSDGRVSLYVRVNRKENSNASPYMYLGEATYVSHNGSKPVTMVWKLNHKIPAGYLLKMKNTD